MPDLNRTGPQLRNADLAQIHIARQQLGLDDETYRAILWSVARVRSSKDLDWTGRKNVLDHFRAKGWKPRPPAKAKASRPSEPGQPGLVRVLWNQLADAGKVHHRDDAALGKWLEHHNMPTRPEWLDARQLNRAIESLKKWLAR